jgi:hypothetical protein
MPRRTITTSLSLVLSLVLASAASAAGPRAAPRSHPYTSVIRTTMLSSALDYPNPKGTAVLGGTLHLDPFGDGTLIDHVTIVGRPAPTVTTFTGREVDKMAGGTVRSVFTGWSVLQPDGALGIGVSGRVTGGTGAFRGAAGTYRFTGSMPPGSSVTSGRSSGTLTY